MSNLESIMDATSPLDSSDENEPLSDDFDEELANDANKGCRIRFEEAEVTGGTTSARDKEKIKLRQSYMEMKDFSSINDDIEKTQVFKAAEEAGWNAFGIIGVDVWLLDPQTGRFLHDSLWVNPIFKASNPNQEELTRIESQNHPQYVRPIPLIPGVGLPGYFWSLVNSNESSIPDNRTMMATMRKSLPVSMLPSLGGNVPMKTSQSSSYDVNCGSEALIWRKLREITSDPFQPPCERVKVLEKAGFGKATGLPFNIMGRHKGVVVYYARETANEAMLNEETNVTYLRLSAQHIGTVSSLTQPKLDAAKLRRYHTKKSFQRVKFKFLCLQNIVNHDAAVRDENSFSDDSLAKGSDAKSPIIPRLLRRTSSLIKKKPSTNDSCCLQNELGIRISSIVSKSKGSKDIRPPPASPWSNATWAFVCSFLTFLSLFCLKDILKFIFQTNTDVTLAPFGALLSLLYTLTAAPPSQPRNILYGQVISLSIAAFAHHILVLRFAWSKEIVISFAAACSISVMNKVGLEHPPAVAALVALLASREGITFLSCSTMLLGNCLSIFLAIVLNNLSKKRQYPIYWRLAPEIFPFTAPAKWKNKMKIFGNPMDEETKKTLDV